METSSISDASKSAPESGVSAKIRTAESSGTQNCCVSRSSTLTNTQSSGPAGPALDGPAHTNARTHRRPAASAPASKAAFGGGSATVAAATTSFGQGRATAPTTAAPASATAGGAAAAPDPADADADADAGADADADSELPGSLDDFEARRRRAVFTAMLLLLEHGARDPDHLSHLVAPMSGEELQQVAEERALAGRCGNPLCDATHYISRPPPRRRWDPASGFVEPPPPSHFCSAACELLVESYAAQLGDPLERLQPGVREMLAVSHAPRRPGLENVAAQGGGVATMMAQVREREPEATAAEAVAGGRELDKRAAAAASSASAASTAGSHRAVEGYEPKAGERRQPATATAAAADGEAPAAAAVAPLPPSQFSAGGAPPALKPSLRKQSSVKVSGGGEVPTEAGAGPSDGGAAAAAAAAVGEQKRVTFGPKIEYQMPADPSRRARSSSSSSRTAPKPTTEQPVLVFDVDDEGEEEGAAGGGGGSSAAGGARPQRQRGPAAGPRGTLRVAEAAEVVQAVQGAVVEAEAGLRGGLTDEELTAAMRERGNPGAAPRAMRLWFPPSAGGAGVGRRAGSGAAQRRPLPQRPQPAEAAAAVAEPTGAGAGPQPGAASAPSSSTPSATVVPQPAGEPSIATGLPTLARSSPTTSDARPPGGGPATASAPTAARPGSEAGVAAPAAGAPPPTSIPGPGPAAVSSRGAGPEEQTRSAPRPSGLRRFMPHTPAPRRKVVFLDKEPGEDQGQAPAPASGQGQGQGRSGQPPQQPHGSGAGAAAGQHELQDGAATTVAAAAASRAAVTVRAPQAGPAAAAAAAAVAAAAVGAAGAGGEAATGDAAPQPSASATAAGGAGAVSPGAAQGAPAAAAAATAAALAAPATAAAMASSAPSASPSAAASSPSAAAATDPSSSPGPTASSDGQAGQAGEHGAPAATSATAAIASGPALRNPGVPLTDCWAPWAEPRKSGSTGAGASYSSSASAPPKVHVVHIRSGKRPAGGGVPIPPENQPHFAEEEEDEEDEQLYDPRYEHDDRDADEMADELYAGTLAGADEEADAETEEAEREGEVRRADGNCGAAGRAGRTRCEVGGGKSASSEAQGSGPGGKDGAGGAAGGSWWKAERQRQKQQLQQLQRSGAPARDVAAAAATNSSAVPADKVEPYVPRREASSSPSLPSEPAAAVEGVSASAQPAAAAPAEAESDTPGCQGGQQQQHQKHETASGSHCIDHAPGNAVGRGGPDAAVAPSPAPTTASAAGAATAAPGAASSAGGDVGGTAAGSVGQDPGSPAGPSPPADAGPGAGAEGGKEELPGGSSGAAGAGADGSGEADDTPGGLEPWMLRDDLDSLSGSDNDDGAASSVSSVDDYNYKSMLPYFHRTAQHYRTVLSPYNQVQLALVGWVNARSVAFVVGIGLGPLQDPGPVLEDAAYREEGPAGVPDPAALQSRGVLLQLLAAPVRECCGQLAVAVPHSDLDRKLTALVAAFRLSGPIPSFKQPQWMLLALALLHALSLHHVPALRNSLCAPPKPHAGAGGGDSASRPPPPLRAGGGLQPHPRLSSLLDCIGFDVHYLSSLVDLLVSPDF